MIVKCRECGKEISNTAHTCPYCGKSKEITNVWYGIVWAVVSAGVILLVLFLLSQNINTDGQIDKQVNLTKLEMKKYE